MRWMITLERKTENALNEDIANRHLRKIAKAGERNEQFGFACRAGKLGTPQEINEGELRKRYLVRVKVKEETARTEEKARERFEHVLAVIQRCASSLKWDVVGVQEGWQGANTPEPPAGGRDAPAGARPPFQPIQLDDEVIAELFAGVYERDAHIRLIDDAVQTYVLTHGEVRAHTLLYGEPGGAKSSVLERLREVYDDGHERVKIMDASTMTKAGLEKWILERSEAGALPDVMVFEEIEKVDSKENLKCLGSVMASGYLQRTNAAVGNVQVPAKFLVLATCNDEEALRNFMRGYLWDRFTNRMHCPLPGRDVMRRILLDKVEKIPGGRADWADLALDLGAKMGVASPRTLIGFLAGRSRLESGLYQQDVMAVYRPEPH